MKKYAPLLLIPFFFSSCNDETAEAVVVRQNEYSEKVDSLSLVLERERVISDSLRSKTLAADSVVAAYPLFFGRKYDKIDDPEEFIKSQLKNRPELIPLSPVLGGTMEFRKIDVISEKWLLAIYDDGHIQGKAIMEYQLQSDGNVKYTIVATQEN